MYMYFRKFYLVICKYFTNSLRCNNLKVYKLCYNLIGQCENIAVSFVGIKEINQNFSSQIKIYLKLAVYVEFELTDINSFICMKLVFNLDLVEVLNILNL